MVGCNRRSGRITRRVWGWLFAAGGFFWLGAATATAQMPMTVVVMDPLAAPLACECVEGFAQRDYEQLAQFLSQRIDRPVRVIFSEDLSRTVREHPGQVSLIIGKQSVVAFDAARSRLPLRPIARLTDSTGVTTLTGLFVVPRNDLAEQLVDLTGYRILFGPEDSAEKHAAAIAALRLAGVDVPKKLETISSCTESALQALENEEKPPVAAVISSYALTLLQGCETIERGSLRVVGRTADVPFITVFATSLLDDPAAEKIVEGLLACKRDAKLLKALESKKGFVGIADRPAESKDKARSKKKTLPTNEAEPEDEAVPPSSAEAEIKAPANNTWPSWRGLARDGISPHVPTALPEKVNLLWRQRVTGVALAGIVATDRYVIVADKDLRDSEDIFRCFDADLGIELWTLRYPAPEKMDYGNAPRATPLIHEGKVYLLGAFGDLHCVDVIDGSVVWKMNLIDRFGAELVTWGMSASPLVVDDKLIVNPGAKDASLVALDRLTGKVVWTAAGEPAAYSAFLVGRFGPNPTDRVRQIVGYDADSLGGWDPQTGKRLWRLVPEEEGDFNVPTPVAVDGQLLLSTENNGTRLYGFDDGGKIIAEPIAVHEDLRPDSSTPVVVGRKVFGCWGELFCLDLDDGLKTVWAARDKAFDHYVSLIGGTDRVLITSVEGELLLVRTDGKEYDLVSRLQVFDAESEVLSHPAIVGNRLYIRNHSWIYCLRLDDP